MYNGHLKTLLYNLIKKGHIHVLFQYPDRIVLQYIQYTISSIRLGLLCSSFHVQQHWFHLLIYALSTVTVPGS
jgi:hypothetical protein